MSVVVLSGNPRAGSRTSAVALELATALAGLVNAALLWRALRRERIYVAEAGWLRWIVRIVAGLVAMAAAA